jgi:hypothetical protein
MEKLAKQGRISVTLTVAVFDLAFVTFGCKKSAREVAEEKAIEHHKKESTPLRPASDPAFAELKSQANFVENLHTNGRLPGVSKELKGFFGADVGVYITPDGGSTQEVVFWTRDKPRQGYHYIVGRASSNSSWQINKAWHADPASKVTQEYSVQ